MTPTPTLSPDAGLDAAVAAIFGGGGDGLPALDPAAAPPAGPPDPYADIPKVEEFVTDFIEQCLGTSRMAMEQEWWRVLLYRSGRQWIALDGRGHWRDKRLAKWVPKPVTNKVHETYSAIRSVFATVDPSALARPMGDRPIDITTSETANQLEEVLKADHKMRRVWAKFDFWQILTGSVFLHPWWDADASSHLVQVPYLRCMACQALTAPSQLIDPLSCPSCGTQMAFMEDAAQTEQLMFGKGRTDVCSPLEIGVPDGYTDFDDAPGVVRMRWRPKYYYKRLLDAETLRKLNFSSDPTDRSLQLLRTLALQAEMHDGRNLQAASYGSSLEGLTEYDVWHKPCQEYPEGLFCRVIANGGKYTVLQIEKDPNAKPQPLPYKTPQGGFLWPWVFCPYERLDGRIWGASPLNLVIQKNDQLNQLDSLMQMIVTKVANPVWIHPKGSEVKKLTGEVGLIIRYNPLAGGGANAKPERVSGENIPSSLINLRVSLLKDIEDLVGSYDIIKGSKPAGVEAFAALQLLVEKSQSRFGPVFQERGEAYQIWYALALELERTFGPPERLSAVLGPNATWTFQRFKQADLTGNVTFTVEDGSQVPKTNLGKRAAISQLSELGVINFQQPDTAYRTLQVFGQTDLYPGLDVHVRAALREQSEWEEWAGSVEFMPSQPFVDPMTGGMLPGPPQPTTAMPGERQAWHADPIHIESHIKWANSDGVQTLIQERPELIPWLTIFIQQHMMAMQPPPQPQPGGAGEAAASDREAGSTDVVPSGQSEQAQGMGPV